MVITSIIINISITVGIAEETAVIGGITAVVGSVPYGEATGVTNGTQFMVVITTVFGVIDGDCG